MYNLHGWVMLGVGVKYIWFHVILYLMSLVAGYCKAFERCQGNKNGFDGDGKPLF
jgi:hypothetical protein